ncbi:MAG: NAD-binding protein [SAR324 cluster bacterium]|nr:NAD-binding protein [SAR324 cluster bacterium]
MTEAVGYLGLGLMGTPMTRNLLAAGYPVVVYNRTRAKAEALAAEGAQVADSPAEVARRAPVILACLADAAAVEAVVSGPGGLLETVGAGQVFVDMTTSSPPVSIRLARALAEKGAEMLDAPVSGADVGAIEGTLSIMVGGKRPVFERVLPIFRVLGRRITLMGDRVGAGGYAKLANQIMVATHLASMGEALVFGAKAGLDLTQLEEALSGGAANSEILRLKASKVLSGEFTPGARSTVQVKDLDYIADSMAALGFSLPVVQLVGTLYRELIDMGHGDEDHSAIVRVFEKLAGVEARA